MPTSHLAGDLDSLGKKNWKPSPHNKLQIQSRVLVTVVPPTEGR